MGRQIIGQEFTGKYTSRNPFKKLLIKHFFNTISKIIGSIKVSSIDNIPLKILEVGCGAGFSTQYLKKMFYNIEETIINKQIIKPLMNINFSNVTQYPKFKFEALENRWDLMRQARKRNPDIKIRRESIYNLYYDDNSFDMVIVLEVLEHLEYPRTALREVKRIGNHYFLFSVPHEPLWSLVHVRGDDPGHIQCWKREEFTEMISEHFTIVKRVTSFPWQIILAEK